MEVVKIIIVNILIKKFIRLISALHSECWILMIKLRDANQTRSFILL